MSRTSGSLYDGWRKCTAISGNNYMVSIATIGSIFIPRIEGVVWYPHTAQKSGTPTTYQCVSPGWGGQSSCWWREYGPLRQSCAWNQYNASVESVGERVWMMLMLHLTTIMTLTSTPTHPHTHIYIYRGFLYTTGRLLSKKCKASCNECTKISGALLT